MRTLTFKDLVEKAVKANKSTEVSCNLKLSVDGETWVAYSVSIANRDLLFFCEQGTATYLIDSYGDRHTAELFDWNKE